METRLMITSNDEKLQTDMEMNSAEDHHFFKIPEVNKDLLCSMERKITEERPKLLRTSAGRSSCCVFRVPQSYIEANGGNAYRPDIVSIGPYHHCKSHDSHNSHKKHKAHDLQFKMFEEHKWRYLGSLVSRTERAKGVGLVDYVKAIQSQESEARDCYSETIDLTIDEFVEMMVLDGCFVIEFIRKAGKVVPVEEDDPIFSMSWVRPCLARDLLKLENQIPLFVLQSLFDLSKIPGEETETSLARLALTFFDGPITIPGEVLEMYINEVERVSSYNRPKHVLDLIRSSLIPEEPPKKNNSGPPKNSNSGTQAIHCVTKLRRAGIRCKSKTGDNTPPMNSNSMIQYCVTKLRRAVTRCKSDDTGDSFLGIEFMNGVIEMPAITIDDVTTSFLLNCIAYEQCHRTPYKHPYITTYANLMVCLINTPEDVGLLCDDKVIENHLGSDAEVAQFFNKSGKDVVVRKFYHSKEFDDINEYYRTSCNVFWATFRHKYFDSPWSFISIVAAGVLLLLTFAQTFITAQSYYQSL